MWLQSWMQSWEIVEVFPIKSFPSSSSFTCMRQSVVTKYTLVLILRCWNLPSRSQTHDKCHPALDPMRRRHVRRHFNRKDVICRMSRSGESSCTRKPFSVEHPGIKITNNNSNTCLLLSMSCRQDNRKCQTLASSDSASAGAT